jgi:glutathione S-transferase
MAVKLHRCSSVWFKADFHPCWRVQKALDEAGVEYEVVKEPLLRGRRTAVEENTGQRALPAIELEDGRWIREESKDLAARVREGRLGEA